MLGKIISQPLLLVNFLVEGVLGISMVLYPSLIQNLGGVNIPDILLRTCGVLALSVAFFSVSAIFFIDSQKDKKASKAFVYSSLLIFNLALTSGLLYAAAVGEITYLGTIVHLPLAVGFALAMIFNSYKTSQK
ncbi:hypothetical protein LBMAG34_5840 [Candidatus Saccharibacteria bacterium]|nr:hypothetical protein LBMAG34_5840 [Candidatus Saccharibacteria bacterium]